MEGLTEDHWIKLAQGTCVGRRKLLFFSTVVVERVRVRVTQSVGVPVIRLLQLHLIDEELADAGSAALSDNCPATASSSHSAPYAAGMLVDGNPQTRWGSADGDKDPWVEIDLGRPRKFARMNASELADRVRRFNVEYRTQPGETWKCAFTGGTIGNAHHADFDRVTARFVRLHILEYVGPGPTLWNWQLVDRASAWETVGIWEAGREAKVDLSIAINEAAQYEVQLVDGNGNPVKASAAKLLFEGRDARECLTGVGTAGLRIQRTQAIGPGASSRLEVIAAVTQGQGKIQLRPAH